MSLLRFWRWPARHLCHGTILCCQYVDRPQCNNGYHEPHSLVRVIRSRQQREDA